uniref:UvrABC system protein A n=1 Tax=Desulfatirhabdium butyrativorans TaxID=340467 RepID=A0A7C4RQW1_9BACT
MTVDEIRIRGARQHNLKSVDLDLPKNRIVVITGISGSGKSSLAFDTLYAEGQRRYVESLSTYARQFLERMEKPQVDRIEGLSPAIAIDQKNTGHNPRSTVGTITEIYDYLRLLFARIGQTHCPVCSRPIQSQSIDEILDAVLELPAGSRFSVLASIPLDPQPTTRQERIKKLIRQGFSRAMIDDNLIELEDVLHRHSNDRTTLDIVVDRLVLKEGIHNRLADSIEMALSLSGGAVVLQSATGERMRFSETAVCNHCGIQAPKITPATFSFNAPTGACPTCSGLGATSSFDPDLIVPNPELSLREGAIAVWEDAFRLDFIDMLESLATRYHADIYQPYRSLSESFQQVLLFGEPDDAKAPAGRLSKKKEGHPPHRFEGILPILEKQYQQADSLSAKAELDRFRTYRTCPDCEGTRLNPIAGMVVVGGMRIYDITALRIIEAIGFFDGLDLSDREHAIADRILSEIRDRLTFLDQVGLGYLSLDRGASTLSGGESQRIRLASQIGSKLSGVLYVLDEPSIGLHPRDNRRLIDALRRMRDLGNSVIVVEHDEEMIRSADHVVDMGPGAGSFGGRVVYSGPVSGIVHAAESLTAPYLSGSKCIVESSPRRNGTGQQIRIEGASGNNLRHLNVAFPIGCLTCVTGVSGSGKSTLVIETLYKSLLQRLYKSRIPAAPHERITGIEAVDKVINIDQSPIGRTPRSNPATYTGLFSAIRDVFAKTEEARSRGYKASRFSFNIKGGRCEACGGDGVNRIEMLFLPDVFVTCETCKGKRYNRETLEVTYRGKSIADVLDMTVEEAIRFFERIPSIRSKLSVLADVGLGYITLGQQAVTLSGGEAQRIKLSRELGKRDTGRTLYILDEPTTGLHFEDIRQLLQVLNRLVDAGNTVIMIEHHLDVIQAADYVIDLGPDGGDKGGEIVATGTPEAIAACPASETGKCLRQKWGGFSSNG